MQFIIFKINYGKSAFKFFLRRLRRPFGSGGALLEDGYDKDADSCFLKDDFVEEGPSPSVMEDSWEGTVEGSEATELLSDFFEGKILVDLKEKTVVLNGFSFLSEEGEIYPKLG